MDQLDLRIFDLSPIPMWIQDYSGVKHIFEQWQNDGISNIRAYLIEQPNRMLPCLATIQTLRINQSTLKLYEASNLEEILSNFAKLHFEDITLPQVNFFMDLWESIPDGVFAPINYTCSGKQIDVQLKANIVPGYEDTWGKILLTTEDISPYQNARRYAESLFTYSPSPLWIRDYSKIKQSLQVLRQQKVSNLKQYLSSHPEFVQQCFNDIGFVDVNQATLRLFNAHSKTDFLENVQSIFSIHIHQSFSEQLLQLWDGNYAQSRECTYYTVNGQMIHVLEQFNIFPQSEHDWSIIQVALTDITERKYLENHLQYLGKHDILTQLYNRAFYHEELERLELNAIYPVSCIYLDLNGLKTINDTFGHDIGDQLLIRIGSILNQAVNESHYSASRVGGDEFIILMPHANCEHVSHMLSLLKQLILTDNLVHSEFPISVAMGHSTKLDNESLESVLKRADQTMYIEKVKYYESHSKLAN